MSVFARFAPRLQQAIVARLGWSSLRPVQEEAGQVILDGMNTVILAPTAGGKTEASMFPTLSGLVDNQPETVQWRKVLSGTCSFRAISLWEIQGESSRSNCSTAWASLDGFARQIH